jgi:deoxyribodipyrimidine photo-lyase
MLEGLSETQLALTKRKIKLVVQRGSPDKVIIKLAQNASLVVCDRGYLKLQKVWRKHVAEAIPCQLIQVETDVVVPVNLVSGKAEYAARTIRPKIHKRLEHFLIDLEPMKLQHSSLHLDVASLDLKYPDEVAKSLRLEQNVSSVSQFFQGGSKRAKKVFDDFLANRFGYYRKNRNQPQSNDTSFMGMYLHFGQISPLYLAQMVRFSGGQQDDIEAFLEELIVRRELAMNFVNFTEDYDQYSAIPGWAKKTLAEHKHDKREYLYSLEELEGAHTHDPYWNAAMNEMRRSGYMHNYMRMYWGKKILEWSQSPEAAFETALYLNNKYFLDGRDANSFAGVAWCFGLHDRPWQERAIFGTVRYMNAAGLRRKADPDAYVAKVQTLLME